MISAALKFGIGTADIGAAGSDSFFRTQHFVFGVKHGNLSSTFGQNTAVDDGIQIPGHVLKFSFASGPRAASKNTGKI